MTQKQRRIKQELLEPQEKDKNRKGVVRIRTTIEVEGGKPPTGTRS